MTISGSFPLDPHVQSVADWLPTQWPLFLALVLITLGGVLVWVRTASHAWAFAPAGGAWAIPGLVQWMTAGYVTPPDAQSGGAGKCGPIAAGCLLLPGALVVVAVAAGLGLLAICVAILLPGFVWRRLRGPRPIK